jgi:hypothetical protein
LAAKQEDSKDKLPDKHLNIEERGCKCVRADACTWYYNIYTAKPGWLHGLVPTNNPNPTPLIKTINTTNYSCKPEFATNPTYCNN